ncbi:hypothetical protein JQC72_14970 [Polycladomyces sp. WAk]|uniref:Uncharacterized protein n=1 Tax=Polycladomyces zharkentensis TaxID=2807616 RepID=A0ABS2WNF2_9BACL|nr:hypothetical protein [Polycladomyces sp. WAk]MBN2910800.1 hypothetical protein [Polycladomyces sp. WAk]
MSEQTKLAVKQQQQNQMIMPAGTVEQALQAFQQYQELKHRLGSPEDFQQIGDKQHPKKSFVRKVQRFFNVSCEIIQDEPLYDKNGKIIAWLAKARATHLATGAYQEADGSCGFEEKTEKQRTIHNIRAHAITRAKNRAILDLVGFGEVSAEEINEREYIAQQTRQHQQQHTQQPQGPQGLATDAQRRKIFAMGRNEKKLTDEQIKKLVKYQTGKESTKELTKQEAKELIDLMEQMSGPELVQLIGEKAIESAVEDLPEVEVIDPNAPITDEEIKEAMNR